MIAIAIALDHVSISLETRAPFSSAPHFHGWGTPIRANLRLCGAPVTLPARTWLLRVGWTKHGPLDPGAVPGGPISAATHG